MAKRLTIEGRVQGVGYRYSFAEAASALGLAGWVCNLRNGTVEACVHGDAEAIDAIVTWAKRGPPAARVERVNIVESDEDFSAQRQFLILETH
jgi:acylphosphatase